MKLPGLAALLLSAVCVFPAGAAAPEFPHLSTTGYGEVTAVPDIAVINVEVEETMLTAEQAKQAVDKAVAAFVTRLGSEGVSRESIVSTNLYLSPQYHYPKNGQAELVGYRASRSVTVTIEDLANLNKYLEGALGDGINIISNIELKVKNPEEYVRKARLAAVQDARQKAESLAKGFDMELSGVWQIEYRNRTPGPVLKRASLQAEAVADSYQDSQITIRDQVSVTYKLKD